MHWLETAFFSGLRELDTEEVLNGIARHVTLKGEFMPGVISPSLTAAECRLARLKIFIGDDPQPGLKHMATRAGIRDAVTNLNYTRGFCGEGMVVTALKHVLPGTIIGHAPTLLFSWRYQGEDWQLQSWDESKGMPFAGHPDVMIWAPTGELELVQIKMPSRSKLERIEKLGVQDALKSYRSQMITELYIGRKMGFPIVRSNLMLISWDAIPKVTNPHCRVISLDWEEAMETIPEQIAREVLEDYDFAYTQGMWPSAFPKEHWDKWPCSYCRYPRLGTLELIGCEEQQEWQRYQESGETRLTAGGEAPPDNIIHIKKTRARR